MRSDNNGWVDIRDPATNKLICRIDPERKLLEFKHKRHKTIVDLRQYRGEKKNGS